jgi:hypothetical protein
MTVVAVRVTTEALIATTRRRRKKKEKTKADGT